jgi:hypothetical protein
VTTQGSHGHPSTNGARIHSAPPQIRFPAFSPVCLSRNERLLLGIKSRARERPSLGALLPFATQISNGSRFSVEPSRGRACSGPQLKRTVHKGGGPKFSSGAKRKRVSAANGRKFHPCRPLSKTSNADRRRARSQIGYTSTRLAYAPSPNLKVAILLRHAIVSHLFEPSILRLVLVTQATDCGRRI